MKDDLRYTPSDCFETSLPRRLGDERHAGSHRPGILRVSRPTDERIEQRADEDLQPLSRPEGKVARDPPAAGAAHGDGPRGAGGLWLVRFDTTCGFDLDWCEAEAADDATPDTIERLETGRYFFESAEEARAFASELVSQAGRRGSSFPWRYRWRPEVRDDVLARLLLLNKERAEAERLAGLSPLAAARSTKMMMELTKTSTMMASPTTTIEFLPHPVLHG